MLDSSTMVSYLPPIVKTTRQLCRGNLRQSTPKTGHTGDASKTEVVSLQTIHRSAGAEQGGITIAPDPDG